MTTVDIKSDTTTAFNATLPRDLSDVDTIDFHVGEGTVQSTSVQILDAQDNIVGVSLQSLDLPEGLHPFEFELTYTDGTVETIPCDGYDYLNVVADLA